MAAPRKATETLHASGAFAHDPQRAVGRSLQNDTGELPDAPEELDIRVRDAWQEIKQHAEPGLLRAHHWIAVREGARLLAKSNSGVITPPERGHLQKFLDAFGMTPRSRNYVSVKSPEKSRNAFADL